MLTALVAVLFAASLGRLAAHSEGESGFGGFGSISTADAIGPLPGTAIPSYIDERRQALTPVIEDSVAVISFEVYVDEEKAEELAGDLDVLALLVAAPAGLPEVVDGDLDDWLDEAKEAAELERKGLEKLLPTTEDPDFRDLYAVDIDRLRRLERALDDGGPMVFGVLVKAPAERLRAVAATSGVRLVDVGSADRPDPANTRGLRPEEVTRAGEPPTRPG